MKTIQSTSFAIATAAAMASPSSALGDDHGDTFESASTLAAPSVSASLDSSSDVDWFRLDLPQTGRVIFYTTGSTDTAGQLFDASGVPLAGWRNDSSGSGENFRLAGKLADGTYFMRITTGGTGTTTGDYLFTALHQGHAIPIASQSIPATLADSGEFDLYRLDLTGPTGRVILYSTGSSDPQMHLLDAAGNPIAGWASNDHGVGRNFHCEGLLRADTYYVQVSHGGIGTVGDYTLHTLTQGDAVLLTEAGLNEALELPGDVDLFRVEVAMVGPVAIFSSGTTDTEALLLDASGNAVSGWRSNDHGAGRNFSLFGTVSPGTYFLRVGHGAPAAATGEYAIHMRQAASAIPLRDDDTLGGTIDPHGDIDLYCLAIEAGDVLLESFGATDVTGALHDSLGRSVAGWSDNDSGEGRNFRLAGKGLAPGIYFLVVRGANGLVAGGYSLESSFSEAPHVSVSRAVDAADRDGGHYSLGILANGAWTVDDLPSWAMVSASSGTGDEVIEMILAPNLSGSARSATIRIGGTRHVIHQETEARPALPIERHASLAIVPGVILELSTRAGSRYRIESSIDGIRWSDTGIVVDGTGRSHRVAVAREQTRSFFRAVER